MNETEVVTPPPDPHTIRATESPEFGRASLFPHVGGAPVGSKGGPGRPRAKDGEMRPRCDNEEKRKRVRMALLMLVEGRSVQYIKSIFKKQYHLKYRQTARYIQAARDQLLAGINCPPEELVAMSYGFYMSVLANESTPPKDKLKARLQADQLLGLQAPSKVALTTTKGKDVHRIAAESMSTEELIKIYEAKEAMERAKRAAVKVIAPGAAVAPYDPPKSPTE